MLLGLAGCSAAGSLSMQPVDDAELAERASVELPSADEGARPEVAVAQRAVGNGTARTVATGPPVESGRVYRVGDRFYRFSVTVVGRETGLAVGYLVDANVTAADADRNNWTVADFEDLPATDRESLSALFSRDVIEHSDHDQVGFQDVYRQGELNDSRLATGTVDAVRYEGDLYQITIQQREDRPLQEYRYDATTVAEDPADYGRQLREEYVFELSGLSEAEREIVATATNGSFYAENDDDQAFASLVERFRSQEGVREDEYGGSYVVRYEGELYWVRMDYNEYVD